VNDSQIRVDDFWVFEKITLFHSLKEKMISNGKAKSLQQSNF